MDFFKKLATALIAALLICIIFTFFLDYLRTNYWVAANSNLKEYEIIGRTTGFNPHVKEIQEILIELHFDPGTADGHIGKKTRDVLKKFQKLKGLPATGEVDYKTFVELNRYKKLVKTKSVKEAEEKSKKEEAYYKEKETATQKKVVKKKRNPPSKLFKDYHQQSQDKIQKIQTALTKAKFYNGEVDGKLGPKTKSAIKEFQKSVGLKADGIVGAQTWANLKKYL